MQGGDPIVSRMSETDRRAGRTATNTDFGGQVTAAVPFVGHLGLQVHATTGEQLVRLPVDDRLDNHIGTRHAGALFAAAETASGMAVFALMTRTSIDAVPLVVEASIRYVAPARGYIDATPTSVASDEEVVTAVADRGRASLTVVVELEDEVGAQVASASFTWLVIARRDRPRGAPPRQ